MRKIGEKNMKEWQIVSLIFLVFFLFMTFIYLLVDSQYKDCQKKGGILKGSVCFKVGTVL